MNMNETLITVPDLEKCSALINEVRNNIRRLKEYGLRDDDITSALREEVVLPRLRITHDYRIYLNSTNQEIKMEPLVKAV